MCYLLFPTPVHAQTSLDSPNYKIRLGNFNMTSGTKSSASYNLTDTVGQIAAEFFTGSGYHVKAGFQYIYTLYDFSFSLSSLAVDLGTLIPNTFADASHTLTVTAPGQGYSVSAIATTPLKNATGNAIVDTTCDAGDCTTTQAKGWVDPTHSGFGYNLAGDDISPDFVGTPLTLFRPFPDASSTGVPATIMTTNAAGKNRTATITYRAAPAGNQASGNYTTNIIYIATPVY